MKNIYLTFDYELFLGAETGTVNNCLHIPMIQLMKVLNKYDIKCTLFVDCAYIYRLSQIKNVSQSLNADFQTIIADLKEYIANGHEVQFHYHPQWLFSNFSDGRWCLDFEHYGMGDLEEDFLKKTFKDSKQLVEDLLNVKMSAFRAGGFTLQDCPYVSDLFTDNGISIDSSVVIDGKYKSSSINYDFKAVPHKSMWLFSDSVVAEDKAGSFVELPINTHRVTGIYYYLQKVKNYCFFRKKVLQWGDGKSVAYSESRKNLMVDKLKRIISCDVAKYASLDVLSATSLENDYKKQKGDVMVLISHPKYLTNVSIDLLDKFIANHIKSDKFKTVSHCIK